MPLLDFFPARRASVPSEDEVRGNRQRRRIGLLWLIAGVLLLCGQSYLEWLLPDDEIALQAVRRTLRLPQLSPEVLLSVWAGLCIVALLCMRRLGGAVISGGYRWLAFLTGLLLGSARLAGGDMAAILLLTLTGIATLGWQSARSAGLPLLLGTLIAMVAWDTLLSQFSTIWLVSLGLTAMFMAIERWYIRGTEQQLIAAIKDKEGLIRDLEAQGALLRQAERARTQLLSSISHDLRQPLQAMRLYADALSAHVTEALPRSILERQIRAGDDAVGMLDQFRDFTAIDLQVTHAHPAPVEVRHMLADIVEAVRVTYRDADLTLRLYGPEAWVVADATYLKRVVQNLIINAARYRRTDPAPHHARVVIALRPHGADLALDVIDNGQGIPADQLDEIFKPYVQLGRGGPYQAGSGLGLAIVRGLVKELGMQLAPVRSRPGRGTYFRVLIPAALRAVRPPADTARRADNPADASINGLMLAVLDDEEASRDALTTALSTAGAYCIEAAHVEALVQKLDAEVRFPDALIFDLDLGGPLDGLGAILQLREQWEWDVPALIVTGRQSAERPATLPARCALLTKPVSLKSVCDSLRQIC